MGERAAEVGLEDRLRRRIVPKQGEADEQSLRTKQHEVRTRRDSTIAKNDFAFLPIDVPKIGELALRAPVFQIAS